MAESSVSIDSFEPIPAAVLDARIAIPYHWQAGDFMAGFFAGLREGRLLASVCSKCGCKSLPPRKHCLRCFTGTGTLVEVPNAGKLLSFTRWTGGRSADETAFYAKASGQAAGQGKGPALGPAWGIVQFDGCDTGMLHFINPAAFEKLSPGVRMKAVFRPASERTGAITDILYFDVAS